MAEVVGAELSLETVGRLAIRDSHDSGVVDEDVELAESMIEVDGERLDRPKIGHVEAHHNGQGIASGSQLVGRRCALGFISTGQHHRGATTAENPGRF